MIHFIVLYSEIILKGGVLLLILSVSALYQNQRKNRGAHYNYDTIAFQLSAGQ